MDNEHHLAAIIALQRQADMAQHRRLLVLSGDRSWATQLAFATVEQLGCQSVLWLTDELGQSSPELGVEYSAANKAIRHLGSERQLIIMDAYAGFHPDAFGAITGTLKAGGLFVLLTPEADNWSDYDDPDYERITSQPFLRTELTRRFIARINRSFCSYEGVLRISEREAHHCKEVALPVAPTDIVRSTTDTHKKVSLDGCLTQDQQQAVEAICRVVTGHRRRPLVITSDRGRGKSSALGLAAAKLIKQGVRNIVLTAPFVESVESVFSMLEAQFPQGVRSGLSFSTRQRSDDEVTFVPPDDLILTAPDASLVLVDEAAAIPTPMLEVLLTRYSRIVFASTIHGYEGTGRGFAVRFTKVLDQQTPQWRLQHLRSPIRWAEDDPLEAFVFDALLLNASPGEPVVTTQIDPQRLHSRWLDQDELSQNEALLKQVFGLLVLAHYRTSPDDLRMLLDGPSLRVVAHFYDSEVVAVALVIREGALKRELGDAIWQGRRRPRGHLIPQVLSGFGGFKEATDLKGDRIMRIAVHPKLHQLGLGVALIDEVYQQGVCDGVDYIGASFGATPELINFWQRSGFSPLRLGLQKEAASGTYSVVMMKPISVSAIALCNDAEQRFHDQFCFDLGGVFKRLGVDIVQQLLGSEGPVAWYLDERDVSDLVVFTEHSRVYDSCSRVVEKLVKLSAIKGVIGKVCTKQETDVLIRRVMQKNEVEAIVSELQLKGKKELEGLLRSAVYKLFLLYKANGSLT